MDIWAGMKDARVAGSGSYLPPNFKGIARINRAFLNEDGLKGDLAFISEFQILTSNMPSAVPVGATRSWYQGKLGDRQIRETALGEILAFVGAALGLNELTEEQKAQIQASMPTITGEANPLADREIQIETWAKVTKKGTDFTKHRFSPAAA